MKQKKTVIAAAGLSLVLAVSACSSSKTSTNTGTNGGSSTTAKSGGAASGTPYQVGFDSSLSGPYAANGVGQRNGFNAYIDYTNAHGGVNGHPVKVTALDDAADVSTAGANMTQLVVSDHVSVVAGWLLSNACGAAATIAAADTTPVLCSAVGSNLINPVHPYVYSSRNLQADEAKPMTTFAKTLVKSATPKVAIIIYGSAASSGLQTALKAQVKSLGWNLVANENVPLTQSDVSAQASAIIAAHPDVIVGSLYDPLAVAFMRTLQAQNLNAPFIDYDGASLSGSIVPLKNPNFYVVSSTTLTGQGSGTGLSTYLAATQADNVSPTGPFVNVGYVQAMEVVAGLTACGFPCSGSAMQKAMDSLNLDTGGVTTGPVTYTSSNHDTLDEFSIYGWSTSANAVQAAATGLQS